MKHFVPPPTHSTEKNPDGVTPTALPPREPEALLTPEEFAARLKISRSTVFEWIQKGVLVPGRHFLQIQKTLRFPWPQAWEALLADSVPADTPPAAPPPGESQTPRTPSAQRRAPKKGGGGGPAVNLDY